MNKNIALIVFSCITIALMIACFLLLRGFMSHNEDLRILRADLFRQQVSMRQKQVEITERLEGVDEATRGEVVGLLLEGAKEVDELRNEHGIGVGSRELKELRESLEQAGP